MGVGVTTEEPNLVSVELVGGPKDGECVNFTSMQSEFVIARHKHPPWIGLIADSPCPQTLGDGWLTGRYRRSSSNVAVWQGWE